MIRDLTKSAVSFSWALSLLGLKQTLNLGRVGQNGGDLFAPVTQVAVGQLDESLKGIYRSGDNFQSRAVDLAFSWLNPANWLNPRSWGSLGSLANPIEWINPNTWTRAAASLTQAVTGCCGQARAAGPQQPTAPGAPAPQPGTAGAPPGAAPVSTESAAAGWGPMPPSPS